MQLDEVECHVRWKPNQDDGDITRLIASLDLKKDNEPGLRALNLVTLAYLHFLRNDEEKCSQCLSSARQQEDPSSEDPEPVDATFLIEAMELHLLHRFHRNEQEELNRLQQLSGMWQLPSVRATCWGAKGWTLLSCGRTKNSEAMKALREAMKLEVEAGPSTNFHWVYGLAFAMAKQRRKSDLSGEIGEEKVELWEEAKKLLDGQGKWHPVFLARFAEAIAYSGGRFRRSEELADEAVRLSDKQERHYMVYVICPKVFRALKKMADWMGMNDVKGIKERLNGKERDVLLATESIYHESNNSFLKSDSAFQCALFYIKVVKPGETPEEKKNRISKARAWLKKVNPKNIWASCRLLELDESEPAADKHEILKRYGELADRAEDELGVEAKTQIEFEMGRFRLVEFQDREAIASMRSLIQPLQNVRFISNYKRRQILEALSDNSARAKDKKWFEDQFKSKEALSPQRLVLDGQGRWRLACGVCAESLDVLRSRFRVTSSAGLHDCAETELMIWKDNSWCRVRPRLSNRPNEIKRCSDYRVPESENQCRRSECGGAHGDAEWKLWELERLGQFSRDRFLHEVRTSQQQKPRLLQRRQDGAIVFTETGQVPRKPPVLPKVAMLCARNFSDQWPRLATSGRSGTGPGPCPDPGSCEFAHITCEEELWNLLARNSRDLSGMRLTDEQWQDLLEQQLLAE